MAYEYMLGYMQGRRGKPLLVFGDSQDDIDYRNGYHKGFALYQGDVMIHNQLANRYNK